MTHGELVALLRQTQIATAIKYASLAPQWLEYEKSMYRMWGSFLALSDEESKEERQERANHMKKHFDWVKQLADESRQAEELSRKMEEKAKMAEVSSRSAGAAGGGKRDSEGEIKIDRDVLKSSTPRRWVHTPDIGSSSAGEAVTDALHEAFGKGFHL